MVETNNLSAGEIAGIAIGGLVLIGLLFTAAVWFYRKRKRDKNHYPRFLITDPAEIARLNALYKIKN